MFSLQEAVEIIRSNPYIMLAVNRRGEIQNCAPLEKLPSSPVEGDKLLRIEAHKGCVVIFLKKDKNISESKLENKIQELANSLSKDKPEESQTSGNVETAGTEIEKQNREKYGDPGPFLVSEKTDLPSGERKDGFVSKCFICGVNVYIPSKLMMLWYNSDARVVCPSCSHGQPGELLKTF